MDVLLSVVAAVVFVTIVILTIQKSVQYYWLISSALVCATILFLCGFFGNMLLLQYVVDYASFFNFMKEVLYIHPLFLYFLTYAFSFFMLLKKYQKK